MVYYPPHYETARAFNEGHPIHVDDFARSRGRYVFAITICGILFLFGNPVAHAANVTFVQAVTSTAYAYNVSETFPSSVTASDTIVVLGQSTDNAGASSPSIASVTDTLGNHFTVVTSTRAIQVSPPDGSARDMLVEMAYATGTVSGTDTVTIIYADSSTSGGYMSAIEISPSVLDLTAAATGTSPFPTAGTVTTTYNGEFGVANVFQDDGFGDGAIQPGHGWTMFQLTGGGAFDEGGEYQAQSTAGGMTGNFTSYQSGNVTSTWAAGMAVFAPPDRYLPSPPSAPPLRSSL